MFFLRYLRTKSREDSHGELLGFLVLTSRPEDVRMAERGVLVSDVDGGVVNEDFC